MNMRKLKKLLSNPGNFIRDALIKKYPLVMNQTNIKFQSEEILINSEVDLISPFSPGFNIDIVYSWVDSSDETWCQSKNIEIKKNLSSESFSKDDARFENHNEIFFSLLSIQKYIPWVRKIFIVTDNQIPPIPLGLTEKIFIIDHRDIIPARFLPTFNSHVIEAYIHNIRDLSENFIYFNDDFFASRSMIPAHFFRSNGICSLFVSNKSLAEMSNKGFSTATLTASINCNELLMDKFNTSFDTPLTHTYVPLKKSIYLRAFELFEKEIASFSSNKFRGENDLNMATFLVPYLQYIYGHASPHLDISYYFNIRSPAAPAFYRNLLSVKDSFNAPHSFCANDFNSQEFGSENFQDELVKFLKNYYNV